MFEPASQCRRKDNAISNQDIWLQILAPKRPDSAALIAAAPLISSFRRKRMVILHMRFLRYREGQDSYENATRTVERALWILRPRVSGVYVCAYACVCVCSVYVCPLKLRAAGMPMKEGEWILHRPEARP